MKHLLQTSLLLLIQTWCFSQVQLVKDIYPGSSSAINNSAPNPVILQNKIIFAANDGVHGSELWLSDGTATGTVLLKDINPGIEDSEIKDLTLAGNFVFFTANNGTQGSEIWRTDGTSDGTILIDDINANGHGVSPFVYGNKALAVGNSFYYIGTDGSTKGIWMTDGVAGNTLKIRQSDDVKDLVAAWNGKAIFTEYRFAGNYEASIWESDGIPANTKKIKSVPVTFSGITNLFTPIDSLLYFVMSTPAEGYELWVTDGTSDGTRLVKDIAVGSTDGINPDFGSIQALGQNLFFTVSKGTTLQELWQSDGTEIGTVKVKDLPERFASLPPGVGRIEMIALDDLLLFSTFNNTNGQRELWVTNGTESGTEVLVSNPNGTYLTPFDLYRADDKVFFSGSNNLGRELWQSNGTLAGTHLSADIYTGTSSGNPSNFVSVNDTLYFTAQSFNTGNELHRFVIPTVSSGEPSTTLTPFHIFPNPVKEEATLVMDAQSTWKGQLIQVFNSRGQLVWNQAVTSTVTKMPLGQLANGLYVVQIGNNLQKLLVQH